VKEPAGSWAGARSKRYGDLGAAVSTTAADRRRGEPHATTVNKGSSPAEPKTPPPPRLTALSPDRSNTPLTAAELAVLKLKDSFQEGAVRAEYGD
jgi:hypothetical protein